MEVSPIITLMASFAPYLTHDTLDNLKVLFRGAVLAHGDRTVTGMITAAEPWLTKHWTCYENTFRTAQFEMPKLSRALLELILPFIPVDTPLRCIIDETLIRRYGPYVTGVGMHRDAVRSSKSNLVVTPGHKWVFLSIAVQLPFTTRWLALPILGVLYEPKKTPKRNKVGRLHLKHRTANQLAMILIRTVAQWVKGREIRIIADGAYGTHEFADALNRHSKRAFLKQTSLVSRFRKDATLYRIAPPRHGRGRPRVKGERLPTPAEVANDARTIWHTQRVHWYGKTKQEVRYCTRVGVWYKCGCAPTKVKWVLVRVPGSNRGDEVFFTTDLRLRPNEIIEQYVIRWSLETTFQECREHLGVETMENRVPKSISRTVPMCFSLYSLLNIWFAQNITETEPYVRSRPWYPKKHVTFSDILEATRLNIWSEHGIIPPSPFAAGEFQFRKREKTNGKGKNHSNRRVA